MTEVITALGTALTAVKTDAMSVLGVVLPVAVAILGSILVVRFGIKWFKGLAK